MLSFYMLGNEPEILDFTFEDDTTLSFWTNQKVRKTESVFRSLRGTTCQILRCYDLKPRILEWTDRQTNKRTDRHTMWFINIYFIIYRRTAYMACCQTNKYVRLWYCKVRAANLCLMYEWVELWQRYHTFWGFRRGNIYDAIAQLVIHRDTGSWFYPSRRPRSQCCSHKLWWYTFLYQHSGSMGNGNSPTQLFRTSHDYLSLLWSNILKKNINDVYRLKIGGPWILDWKQII